MKFTVLVVFGVLALAVSTSSATAATTAETTAANWARARLGSTAWGELCLSFAVDAWGDAGVELRSHTSGVTWNADTDPQDVWGHTVGGTTGTGTPPYGALVFFDAKAGYNPEYYSHVTIMGPNEEMISTPDAFNESDVHEETLTQFDHSGAYSTYVGWWLPDGTAGSGGRKPNGSFIKVTGESPIYRVIGGAAIHIDTCAPFNGCEGMSEVANLSEYATEPENGAYVVIANGSQEGQIDRAVGGLFLGLSTCEGLSGCDEAIGVDAQAITEYNDAHPTINSGTFMRVADGPNTGLIGRVVGGVLLGLDTCEGMAGCDSAVGVPESTYDWYASQHEIIENGTLIRVADGPNYGLIGRVVGGVLLGLDTCEGIQGCDAAVEVDEDAYDWYAAQHEIIASGTFIRVADGPNYGLIGRVVGGVLLGLDTCEGIEGCNTAVSLPESTYDWYTGQHEIIANGTYVRVADGKQYGLITRAAGGALIGLSTCEPLEGCPGAVNIDDDAYDWYASLHPTPANGTVLEGLPSGAYWAISDGHRHRSTNSSGAVGIDDGSISAFPVPAPAVATTPATPVSVSSAVLNGTVNPEGEPVSECWFEYGPTTAYGSTAPCENSVGESEASVPVSATVAGLKPDTEYHYRVVAVGPGGTSESTDSTFTTEAFGVTTASLAEGTVYTKTNKVLYKATLTAAGGKPPYKWSLTTGSKLPPGLKLASNGTISGKASSTGKYTFTVQVLDTRTKSKPPTQNKATATLSITITPA